MKRTPQEKKRLSYARDRRNVYGEAPHAARKNIPLNKALRNRANRHYANQQLTYEGVGFDEELADAIESRIKRKAPHEWEKYPDAPLGEVVPRKSRNRAIMQEHGGRKALKTLVSRHGEVGSRSGWVFIFSTRYDCFPTATISRRNLHDK